MIAIPAVDLREGACVQLVGGSYDDERVRIDDPLDAARSWARLGFSRLHVVDLDAATSRGSNEDVVAELLRVRESSIQVGGGVRGLAKIERLLQDGADRVILGTRALEESQWLSDMTARFPNRLIVAADVRDRQVVTHGWKRTLASTIMDVIASLNALPLAAVMVTAVHREGQLAGTDLSLMADVAGACAHAVYASGGISTMADLHALERDGVAGAIIGMALYTGALDPKVVAETFAEEVRK